MVIDRAYQVEDIPIPDVTMKEEYSHLSDLEVPDPSKVTLLIGQDCSEALIPLEVRKGLTNEPYAIRTCLGRSISGPVLDHGYANHTVISMCTSSIIKDIRTLWEIESDVQTLETKPISFDDKNVLQLWEDN